MVTTSDRRRVTKGYQDATSRRGEGLTKVPTVQIPQAGGVGGPCSLPLKDRLHGACQSVKASGSARAMSSSRWRRTPDAYTTELQAISSWTSSTCSSSIPHTLLTAINWHPAPALLPSPCCAAPTTTTTCLPHLSPCRLSVGECAIWLQTTTTRSFSQQLQLSQICRRSELPTLLAHSDPNKQTACAPSPVACTQHQNQR